MLKHISLFLILITLSKINGDSLFPFNMQMGDMFKNMGDMFAKMIPWYKGSNVCLDESFPNTNSGSSMFADEFPESYGSQNSETCRGNDIKYVCIGSFTENGVIKQRIRKYQCCQGFVRPNNGNPGCVPARG